SPLLLNPFLPNGCNPTRINRISSGRPRIGFERGVHVTSITAVAEAFFAACETGKGWEACSAYCAPTATFCAQAEPLLGVKTLAQYPEWMKGMMTVLPDGHYQVMSFATDEARNNVAIYGVFHGTHSGPGGPIPPTGHRTSTDYVYVMQFEGNKIVHMPKIW